MSLTDIIPFRGRKPDPLGDELASALELAEPNLRRTLLDDAAFATEKVLAEARREVARQDAIIAEATETRRQALVVIEAFEPAQKRIVDGADPVEQPKRMARG
jgi:hypothetical protein